MATLSEIANAANVHPDTIIASRVKAIKDAPNCRKDFLYEFVIRKCKQHIADKRPEFDRDSSQLATEFVNERAFCYDAGIPYPEAPRYWREVKLGILLQYYIDFLRQKKSKFI